jgi:uncharacterized protein YhaN
MKINHVRFHGFGRYINQEFQFGDGINLLEASNESGKTTLLQGILALLYGRNREGYRRKTKAEWFDRYLPWEKADTYGGEIEYQVVDERYRLVREFFSDDQQLIKLSTGEDITQNFPLDQKKERLYLERQTGVSLEMLKRMSFIHAFSGNERIHSTREANRDQELIHRFNLLLRQGEEVDIEPAIEHLRHELESIGTKETAHSTPYGQACQQLKRITEELRACQEIKRQIDDEESKVKERQKVVRLLEQKCQNLQRQIAEEERKKQEQDRFEEGRQHLEKLYLQQRSWQQKADELNRLKQRKQMLEEQAMLVDIPSDQFEEVEQYLQLCQEIENKLQQIRQLKEEHRSLQQTWNKRLLSYQTLQKRVKESQAMLENLEQYQQLEDLHQQELQREEAEQKRQEDWDQDAEQLHAEIATHWARHGHHYGFGLFCVSLMLAIMFSFFRFDFSLASSGVAILSFFYWAQRLWRRKRKHKALFQKWQIHSFEEFFALPPLWKSEVEKQTSSAEWEQRMESIRQQVRFWLQESVDELPSFDPEIWKKKIFRLTDRWRAQQDEARQCEMQESFLQIQLDRLQHELRKQEQQQQHLRTRLGIESNVPWQKWKKWWHRSQAACMRLQELNQEIAQREAEREQEQWEEKLTRVQGEIERWLGELQGACCERSVDHSTPEQRLEKLNRDLADTQSRWQAMKEQLSKQIGILEVQHQRIEQLSELEALARHWERRKEELEQRRVVCNLAITLFEQARKKVHEDVTPRLAPYASQWISAITKERYQKCHLSPEDGFVLRFQERHTGKLFPVELLSQGTVDQVYFALRLAFVHFYAQQTKPACRLPLFLDDCFVHFDEERLREALRVLETFAQNHQIILCTCHRRERKLLEEEKIPFTAVSLKK